MIKSMKMEMIQRKLKMKSSSVKEIGYCSMFGEMNYIDCPISEYDFEEDYVMYVVIHNPL